MAELTNYISPELLILIPVLYFVGLGIKRLECINDKCIPIILGCISVALSAIWVLAANMPGTVHDVLIAVFTAVTQGVLVAAASVYCNQVWKQLTKGNDAK